MLLLADHTIVNPLKSKHVTSVAAALRDVLEDPVLAGRTPRSSSHD
jgi:hypothetical protein